jgi:rare lipoprotein A
MDARSGLRRLLSLRAAGAKPLIAVTAAVITVVLADPAVAREPRVPADPGAARTETRPHVTAKTQAEKRHRKQVGTASFYARRFGGRKMADGTRLDLNDHVAASRAPRPGSRTSRPGAAHG